MVDDEAAPAAEAISAASASRRLGIKKCSKDGDHFFTATKTHNTSNLVWYHLSDSIMWLRI